MKFLACVLLALMTSMAFAKQTRSVIENPSLTIKKNQIVLTGKVKSKKVSGNVGVVFIKGVVAGQNCGADHCFGALLVNEQGDVFLKARVDMDNDGQIDASESVLVGKLDHNRNIEIDITAEYEYVVDKYTIFEHWAGAKDSEYVAVTLSL